MRSGTASYVRPFAAAALMACLCTATVFVDATPGAAAAPGQDPAPGKQVTKKKAAANAKKAAANAPAPTPDPAPKATQPASAAKAEVVIDKFWDQPEQLKVWDLDKLTPEDEAKLGANTNQAILHNHPQLKVGSLPRRFEDAAEPYLKSGSRKEVNYTFTVLDCEGSNVFSAPGGYIYVCRGLFDWVDDEEDYVLEFMIAHEMAHIDLAHAITNLRDPEVKKLGMGTVPLFYSVAIPWGNTEAQEYEADKWAWERMKKLERSPYKMQAFLRKLVDYSKKNGFENFALKPTEPPSVPLLDNHIRAHPAPYKRLRALRQLINPALKP
jgi:predicted Zn-dependent protease